MGYIENIRKGFSLTGRNPELVSIKFALGFIIPLATFVFLSFLVVSAMDEAFKDIISAGGAMTAIKAPQEAFPILARLLFLFYLVFLVTFLVYLAGNSIADVRCMRVISGKVLGITKVDGREWRKIYGAMTLYSVIWSIFTFIMMFLFGIVVLLLIDIISAFTFAEGMVLKTTLVLTAGSAFVIGSLYLQSSKLAGSAFIVLDRMRPMEAFLRSLRGNSYSLNLIACMFIIYGLIQPLMALGAWGLWNVPGAGQFLVCIWGVIWIVIDIYLGFSIKAIMLIAHKRMDHHVSTIRRD